MLLIAVLTFHVHYIPKDILYKTTSSKEYISIYFHMNRTPNIPTYNSTSELNIKAIHAPCHTKGHILYYVYKTDEAKQEDHKYKPILFTGDTLFIAGCGRFFEGSAKDMFKNIEKVKNMRKETLIYCGHEYTLNNLRKTKKAASIDPVEPDKVLKRIETANVELEYVLCTHHHYDHSGGNIRMRELKQNIKVVGSAYEPTPGVNEKVYDGQIIRLGR
ncbi:hypothetical protein PFUGPA_00451 [Plasmodium falciparum Palo Alto/Uganda]|uniref:Metallo-beta-lactamase domain-containing protein n=1 Tax=Plasmodium falciparum (isolate Palo Alto / Uganda) TaxID=57270 RepID=W4J7I8_PLAFP|nr:hypothetical protein PFUGPA_00451 [Plasmodium falciparum Palo Alto/Uganda]